MNKARVLWNRLWCWYYGHAWRDGSFLRPEDGGPGKVIRADGSTTGGMVRWECALCEKGLWTDGRHQREYSF